MSAAALVAVFAAAFPLAADAHGFGERYDLPLPLSLFVIAGAAAVALSFVVAAVFLRAGSTHTRYPRYNLLRLAPVRWLAAPPATATLKTLSVALTVYVIVGALIGNERAALNPAPAAIYVAFWVGLELLHRPLRQPLGVGQPVESGVGLPGAGRSRSVSGGGRLSLHHRYPARIGPWPAVLVFVGFAILETVAADAAGPRALGWILVSVHPLQLRRHVRLRPRGLAPQRRGVHRGIRFHVPFLGDRGARADVPMPAMLQQWPLLRRRNRLCRLLRVLRCEPRRRSASSTCARPASA